MKRRHFNVLALVGLAAPAIAQTQAPVILVVGDSLSAEYGLKRGTGWVALLDERLKKEKVQARIVNASISGDTTSGGRSRIAALLKQHKPAAVVIELGGNDALRGLPLNMTRENLTAMVKASKAAGARVLLERVPEAVIAVSGAKSFGIYRERVGALFVKAAEKSRAAVMSNLAAIARANYSMPPDHGAAIVREVLSDEALRASWREELDQIRTHIKRTRAKLAAERVNSLPMHLIAAQKGMFSTLPLSGDQVTLLREQHGIYMTDAARINVAGLRESDIPRFVEALRAVA